MAHKGIIYLVHSSPSLLGGHYNDNLLRETLFIITQYENV